MNNDIIQAMRTRQSVRTFAGKPLDPEQREALDTVISEARSPFAPASEVSIALRDFDLSGPYKPSTYGFIKGAVSFLLMGYGDSDDAALAAGFTMEQVVLRAQELGLGTCWIAATFKGSDFEAKADLPEGRKLKIIIPVGLPAEKASVSSSLARFLIRSNTRKDPRKLFFQTDFDTPLSDESTYRQSLEMMRIAPSSTNSQPWRALVDEDGTVHFYYTKASKIPCLDCGIGLCHFALAEQAQGFAPGVFFKAPEHPESPAGLTYLRSYRRNPAEG